MQFIPELYDRGVRNFVVHKKIPVTEFPAANFILVKDSLDALQTLAVFHRRQFNIPVIGISGSNGKTIVKEWLNQMLEDKFTIVRSPKSYNSQIGVPLSVWQMSSHDELGIFEAGISRPGEMRKLEKMIRPTIGIFTNIGEAHSEGFRDKAKKIREKLELFKHASALIYSRDHAEIDHEIKGVFGKSTPALICWGKSKDAWLKIKTLAGGKEQTKMKVQWGIERGELKIPFSDDASIENAITCTCMLAHLGYGLEEIQNKLYALSPVAMRLEWQHGINHCSIINDSYSADLSSLKIALDFLSQQRLHPKRTVILSDILESGKDEKKLYRDVSLMLQQNKIDRLIGIGGKISAHQDVFSKLLKAELSFFPSTDDFVKHFLQINFRDETILIKGARIFGFEKIDHLLAQQAHQTALEINLTAIVHNLKQYQQLLKPSTKIMAMVKAFAYGAGSYEIASLLQFQKIDWLAVAYTDEGVELRRSGISLPIMVMNAEETDFDTINQFNLEPVIYSFRLLEAIENYTKKEGITQFPVHIEIESGMNRLGFATTDLDRVTQKLQSSALKIQSLFSHLAASEEKQQDSFTQEQANRFLKAAGKMRREIPYSFLLHMANSAAIVRHRNLQLDMVRLGIGLYGVDSTDSHSLDLRQVASLRTRIAQIKELASGETVGYNRKGVIENAMRIATVRIGYADGYPRTLGNGIGKMLIGGKLAETIGDICMDMTMINVSNIPEAAEGHEVIVFGQDLPIHQLAHWAGTIPYEILTGVSQRVKRIYYEE
jgi:alanine racemase